jgi:NAD(P)H-dependent FMN reductase
MTTVSVIIGSTRRSRFSEKPARWIFEHLQKREGIEPRLLDLRDFPMPFYEDHPTTDQTVQRWREAIAASDAYIVVSPEYNYGPPAVLKNAIDWVYREWNRKPVAFVSYGSVGGARTVQQLREISVELQLAPIRFSVHIPAAVLKANREGGDIEKELTALDRSATAMIDDLLWWTAALKTARAA